METVRKLGCANSGSMNNVLSQSQKLPGSVLLKLALPMLIPFLLALILGALVGARWPTNIAPGSGLKLAGLVASVATCLLVWRSVARAIADSRQKPLAAAICVLTGLMGWAFWSAGVLPNVNGFILGSESKVHMAFEGTSTTRASRQPYDHHWARLKAEGPDSPIGSGLYYISEQLCADWNSKAPESVNVTVAPGLLGAPVVLEYK